MLTLSAAVFEALLLLSVGVAVIAVGPRGRTTTHFRGQLKRVFYNTMIENSDIRFSYEQKNQYLSKQLIPSREKIKAGKLVSKREENQPLDEQQDELITRKSIVLNGDTLKNSQIYSRIRINRSRRETPKIEAHQEKYSFNQEATDHARPLNETASKSQNVIDNSKNLPRIMTNVGQGRHSEIHNGSLSESFHEKSFVKEEQRNIPKGRSFSINHYDMYQPGFLMSRQELSSSRRKNKQLQEINSQNRSKNKGEHKGQLQEQKPQPALNINFQNSTERDLPESQQPELSASHSKVFQNTQRLNQINPDSNLPDKIERQPIAVHNPVRRNGSSAQSRPKLRPQQQTTIKQLTSSKPSGNQLLKQDITINSSHNRLDKNAERQVREKAVKAKVNDVEIMRHIEAINEDVKQTDSKIQSTPIEKITSKDGIKSNQPELNLEPRQCHQPTEESLHRGYNYQQTPEVQKQENFLQKNSDKQAQKEMKEETNRTYQYHKFSSQDYMKVYQMLKKVHTCLKTPLIDGHALLKEIKLYLETVAAGSLDHIQAYSMPLHRLKIIKNALLYERIAVVIISFALAVGKIKECLKYLVNLICYCTSNTLLILKILENSELEKDVAKNPIIAKSDRLILKRNFDTVRNSNDIILDSIFKISKTEEAFYDSFKDIVKSAGKNSLEQTFYNVLEYFSFFLCVSGLHKAIPFLAVAPNPYLRETLDKRPTLVIDIVEVFCHGTRKSKSHIFRPHTQYFLSQMSQYYEIVSFTCAYPNQIDKIIDILDPHKYIKHRLYRHHALTRHNLLYKDIERLGREIHKMILLDSEDNVLPGESTNTILIPLWKGGKNDTTLAELCPILATIAVKNMDCLEAVRRINQQHVKNQSAGIKYLNFGINLD